MMTPISRPTLMPVAPLRRFLQKGPWVVGLTTATVLLGLLALVSPLGASETPGPRVGFLLAFAASFEVLHGIRRSTVTARRKASIGALISMVIALFLINAPYLAGAAVLAGMAGFFLVDAARYGLSAWRETERRSRGLAVLAMLGNLAVALVLVIGARVGHDVDGGGCGGVADLRHRMEHRRLTGPHGCGRRGIGRRRIGLLGQRAGRGDVGRDRSEREGARTDRSRLDSWHSSPRSSRFTSAAWVPIARCSGCSPRRSPSLGDMMVACLITLLVINPALSALALADAMDRASVVAMVCRTGRCGTGAVASAVGHRVAAPTAAIRRAHARGPLLGSGRAESGAADRPAARGGHRGDGPGLGHELVLRHRELGGRHVELLGRGAHRHVARGDGPRRARGRRRSADSALPFAVQPPGVDSTGDFSFIVIGDTGEGDASQHVLRDQLLTRREPARRALRRHLVRRRLSDRRDEGLRGEVLAAVQGRDQAGLRHSRQSRLVRRARGVRRDVSSSPTPRARACARGSRPTCG